MLKAQLHLAGLQIIYTSSSDRPIAILFGAKRIPERLVM